MLVIGNNQSGEGLGGSLNVSDTGGSFEHSSKLIMQRKQPLITLGKGDLQAQAERLGAKAFRMSAQEWWPF